MTRSRLLTFLWGLLFVLFGVVGLLFTFGALDDYKLILSYAVSITLALAGLVYLGLMLYQKKRWDYAIPGFSLLALAGVVFLPTVRPIRPELLGALFLAGMVLGFLVIFLADRVEHWWALLQAATLLTIGVVGLLLINLSRNLDTAFPEYLIGAALLGGFALSYFFVYLFTGERRRFQWALLMAVVLGAFAMLLVMQSAGGGIAVQLWPVVLLIVGVFLLARAIFSRGPTAPPQPVPIDVIEPEEVDPDAVIDAEPAQIIPPEQPVPSPSPTPAAIPAEPQPLPPEPNAFAEDDGVGP